MASCALLLAASLGAQVRTVAGNGTPGHGAAQVNNPYGLVVGPDGAVYFCDIDNHRIRRLDLTSGALRDVVGSGEKGYGGDGGPALQAKLNQPYEVRFDRQGNLYWVEMPNHVVRRMDRKTRHVTTVAGTGEAGFGGDGGPGTQAKLDKPHSIAFDREGGLLICDIGNHRVRRLDVTTGLISTYAGTGERKPTPDGAPRIGTPLNGPRAIDTDEKGTLYLVLREGNAVYRIDPARDRIEHVAGTGQKGYTGDGGPAKAATFNGPKGVAYAGNALLIADTENHVIRHVDLKTGTISTLAGSGERGDGPDGEATQVKMNRPHGLYADRRRKLVLVGDSEAHRIRVMPMPASGAR